MKFTDEDLYHIASRRAIKPFLPYLRIVSLITLLLAIFFFGTEFTVALIVLAFLWTIFIGYITYATHKRRKVIIKELHNEQG